MSAKKKPVSTPLHLLHQLSHSLLEHLENACAQAAVDAEKLLAKLEKQRGKGQEKLHTARLKLQDAAKAGKVKAQAKARDSISELETLLDILKTRQTETRTYIAQLKRDAQESLKLAQGVGKVREAASKALGAREAKATVKPVAKPAVKPVTKTAATKPTAKATATKPSAKQAARPAASKPAAKPTSKPAAAKPTAKPAAKATVAAKPATKQASKPAAKPTAKPVAKKAQVKASADKPAAAKPTTTVKPAASRASVASGAPGSNGATPVSSSN